MTRTVSETADGRERIGGAQWRALLAAWLGWAFDGLDGYLYVMVAGPFVRELLESELGAGNVPRDLLISRSSIIQCVFLVGWAVGGAVFGRLGDRLGRSRTLTFTVLTYALFTGASCLATRWWHLLIFRFIAALGIGGEWAAGSALVSETLPERHRSWASAALQSGYMVGCIAAGYASAALTAHTRWVFLVGVLPAVFTLWIRWAVPEPEGWARARQGQAMPSVSALFAPGIARTTVLLTALASVALTTVWAFLFFAPQMIGSLPGVREHEKPWRDAFSRDVATVYFIVNIIANFFGTYLARAFGYRRAFAFMMVGSLLVFLGCYGRGVIGFGPELTSRNVAFFYSLTAFFSLGLFGMFPLYIPRLFPTLLRTLGAGFTYNTGRLVSAAGVVVGAFIVQNQKSTGQDMAAAIWWTGLLYVPGIAIAMLIPEPARDPEAS